MYGCLSVVADGVYTGRCGAYKTAGTRIYGSIEADLGKVGRAIVIRSIEAGFSGAVGGGSKQRRNGSGWRARRRRGSRGRTLRIDGKRVGRHCDGELRCVLFQRELRLFPV